MATISVTAIGWRAHAALTRSGGAARPLGAPSGYLVTWGPRHGPQTPERSARPGEAVARLDIPSCAEGGGEIVWLGTPGEALHGRAILTETRWASGGDVRLDLGVIRPWRPPPETALDAPDARHAPAEPSRAPSARRAPARPPAEALAAAGERLCAALERIGEPRGFGTLLAGRTPAFPLEAAAPAAGALARACAAGDAAGAARAARALVGLGPGLTPSGDDLVGGAFFARARLAPAPPSGAWARAAGEVRALARARTHPVSAALLGDLLAGEGWAPLHDLARAVAADDGAAAVAAAGDLVRLGHSSGWDLLTGFLAALTGGRLL